MSATEAHKDVVRSYYEKLWNDQNFDLVSEIIAEDLTFKGLTDLSRLRVKVGSGRTGFKAYVQTMHSFLSNYHIEVEDMVAEGDKVFCRTVVCGVHRGQFMGFAPTLKRIEWRGCALFTFGEDGLIHDIWALNDDSDLEEKLKTNKSLMHT